MSVVDDRFVGAVVDVAAVEYDSPGMVRVITFGGSYRVDARDERCTCPDWEYRLGGRGRCKHIIAALLSTGQIDVGFSGLPPLVADVGDRHASIPAK